MLHWPSVTYSLCTQTRLDSGIDSYSLKDGLLFFFFPLPYFWARFEESYTKPSKVEKKKRWFLHVISVYLDKGRQNCSERQWEDKAVSQSLSSPFIFVESRTMRWAINLAGVVAEEVDSLTSIFSFCFSNEIHSGKHSLWRKISLLKE